MNKPTLAHSRKARPTLSASAIADLNNAELTELVNTATQERERIAALLELTYHEAMLKDAAHEATLTFLRNNLADQIAAINAEVNATMDACLAATKKRKARWESICNVATVVFLGALLFTAVTK